MEIKSVDVAVAYIEHFYFHFLKSGPKGFFRSRRVFRNSPFIGMTAKALPVLLVQTFAHHYKPKLIHRYPIQQISSHSRHISARP